MLICFDNHLLGSLDSLPGVLLELGDGGVQCVGLRLQRLHLLADRVHCGAILWSNVKNINIHG